MRKLSKFTLLLFILLLGTLLTACGSEAADNMANYEPSPAEMPAGEPAADTADTSHNESSTALQERIIIMEGFLTVSSYEPTSVVNFISELAERYGGFVIESTLNNTPAEDGAMHSQGYIKIRVPAERLTAAIEEIEAQDLTVIDKDLSGKDVTAEYVDLQSKLRNLEATAEQLQQIMDNATDTEAVLEVYRELSNVNQEAEVIRGQIQYYDEVSSMSSLSVQVEQTIDLPEPTPTPTPKPWSLGPAFEDSTEDLSRSMKNWLEGLVWFIVYFIPNFVLRVAPWLLAIYFGTRWIYRKIRKSPKEPEKEPKTE